MNGVAREETTTLSNGYALRAPTQLTLKQQTWSQSSGRAKVINS